MALPPLDICKLEAKGRAVVEGVDMNEVWHVVCKLSDETDNVRLTGNQCFDARYLNYYQKGESAATEFYDRDAKVKGDWRTHFLTRTVQILLHSFDPSRLPVNPVHSTNCDCSREDSYIPEQGYVELTCDCWGCGIDPTHRTFLQRLSTVPAHSNIAKSFCKLERRAAHFKDTTNMESGQLLLVPFRYSTYFADDFEASMVNLLSLLVKECQFRPKLLPVHCEFFHHSELYQLYLCDGHRPRHQQVLARALFDELLSELEHIEFYWVGGLRGKSGDKGELTFGGNPSIHAPKVFLESVLGNPSPRLDTLCIRVYGSRIHFGHDKPKIDSCLADIAPLFSDVYARDCESSVQLPVSAPYKGLEKLHIFGDIGKQVSGSIISSILLHQTCVRGLELSCDSKVIGPGDILEPLREVLSQSTLSFLVVTKWREYNFKEIFHEFLANNRHCEIRFTTSFDEVIIPVRSESVGTNSTPTCRKVLMFYSTLGAMSYQGVIFSWLLEAEVISPLNSISISSTIRSYNEEGFLTYLSTCKSFSMDIKDIRDSVPEIYFKTLRSNRNLQVLKIHKHYHFVSRIDSFMETIAAVFANCGGLTELSLLGNRIGSLKLPQEKLQAFFELLVSYPRLDQLSIDLRGNAVKDAVLDVFVKAWQSKGGGRQFKSVKLDSSDLEEKLEDLEIIQL